ncbi:MAG: hypothetical protein WCS72_12730, partial [Deltaproteobacteria bacterium]
NLITDNRGDEPIVLFSSNTHTSVGGNRVTQNARCAAGTGSASIQLDGLNFYNSVVGNTLDGCPTYHIYLHDRASFNTVVGNVLNNALLGAIRVDATSHGNTIDLNICTNILNATDPYLSDGPTYAIGIAAGCNDNYIGPGNIIAGCAGGTISNLGGNSGNAGTVPVGIGTRVPYKHLDVRGGDAAVTTTDFAYNSAGTALTMSLGGTTGNQHGVVQVLTGGGVSSGNGKGLVLNPWGNAVAIGKSAPGSMATLEVGGNVAFVVPGGAPTLDANYTVSFQFVSNTGLKILMRGADGTTRSVTLTLA